MADLLDYLDWRGDLDFNASSFNKVDALMLSLISYNIFDGFLNDSFAGRKSMQEILEAFYKAPDFEERKDIGAMINEKTFDVFEKMVNVARFKDLQLTAYKSVINLESTEQFAAITFIWGKTNIVVFRGTDDSIVGWKEDFNISWQNPIPSQNDALDYFDKAAASLKGDFILIGHSKGGNLVVNTAAKTSAKNQKRILTVYNFDGPGFENDYYLQAGFLNVKNKIKSFYPAFSIVGMIFKHPEDFEIVQSNGSAIMQHDPLTWQISGPDFIHEEDFTSESKFFYTTFNEWVKKISIDQRKIIVATLFDIIEASGCTSNKELVKNRIHASAKMIEAYAKLNRERKNDIHKIVRVLRQAVHDSLPMLSLINVNQK